MLGSFSECGSDRSLLASSKPNGDVSVCNLYHDVRYIVIDLVSLEGNVFCLGKVLEYTK